MPVTFAVQVVLRQALYHTAPRSLYLIGGAGLLLAAVLLFPGNPIWDLSQARVPNTVLVYLSLLPIMVASYRDRERLPRWFAMLSPGSRWVLLCAIFLGPVGLWGFLGWQVPLYLRSLGREWGLIEPLSFLLYWVATWHAISLARRRQAQNQEAKPYYLLALLCGLSVLEECDYLGIFGGLVGRIHGVYVGAPHDLFTLWYRTGHDPRWAISAAVVGLILGAWLWRYGYISAAFLRRELCSPTSLPLLLGVGLLALAQILDIDSGIVDRAVTQWWCAACEETMEFFFTILLNISLILKYIRDVPPVRYMASLEER